MDCASSITPLPIKTFAMATDAGPHRPVKFFDSPQGAPSPGRLFLLSGSLFATVLEFQRRAAVAGMLRVGIDVVPTLTLFASSARQSAIRPDVVGSDTSDGVEVFLSFACLQFALRGVVKATIESDEDKDRLCPPIWYWDTHPRRNWPTPRPPRSGSGQTRLER